MGQAKRRGTFEQRKAESVERQKIEEAEHRRRLAEREANKTPKQRLREEKARAAFAAFAGMALYAGEPLEYTKRI